MLFELSDLYFWLIFIKSKLRVYLKWENPFIKETQKYFQFSGWFLIYHIWAEHEKVHEWVI